MNSKSKPNGIHINGIINIFIFGPMLMIGHKKGLNDVKRTMKNSGLATEQLGMKKKRYTIRELLRRRVRGPSFF